VRVDDVAVCHEKFVGIGAAKGDRLFFFQHLCLPFGNVAFEFKARRIVVFADANYFLDRLV